MVRIPRLAGVLMLLLTLPGAALVHAQAYPNRPIRMVVPWPPSGTVDILARPLAQRLSEVSGQPVIVDNRPGANSMIGSEFVARATADGYTLLVDNVTGHAINASLYKKIPFDSLRDFAPVTLLASVTNLLVVANSTGLRSVKDILAAAQAKPGTMNFASFGTGSTAHLAGELFKTAGGFEMAHIPYKGGAPALVDVMAGRATMMFATLPSALGFVKAGKLVAIATTGSTRSPATPEVPTVAESGLPGFEATTWYGALLPAATPAPVITSMQALLGSVVSEASMRELLLKLGFEVRTSSPDDLGRHLKSETTRWGQVIRTSGIRID